MPSTIRQAIRPAIGQPSDFALTRTKGGGVWSYAAATASLQATLTDAGIWSKGEELYIFAADTEAEALTNLLTGTTTLSKVGTVNFTARCGFAGNGVNGRLEGRAYSTMTKLGQNSLADFIYAGSSGVSGSADFGSSLGGEKILIQVANTATTAVVRQNTTNANSITIAREWGFRGSSRTGSANYIAQMDGVQSTVTEASVGLPGGNLVIGGASTVFARRRLMAAGMFSGLSAAEMTILRDAVELCLSRLGALARQLWGEGDSYMAGSTGVFPLNGELSIQSARPVNNTAAGGSTMATAASRMAALTARFSDTLVFWDGSPDGFVSVAASMANYATIVGLLGHDRYLIAHPVRRAAMSAQLLQDTLDIQTALAAAYPGHIFDAQAALAALGDPVADAADIAANVVPSSLLVADNTHLKAGTLATIAGQMATVLTSNGW